MFKKILLGLGLLGVLSSANAACTFKHSFDINYFGRIENAGIMNLSVNPGAMISFQAVANKTVYYNGGHTAKYVVRADSACNLSLEESSVNTFCFQASCSILQGNKHTYIPYGSTVSAINCVDSQTDECTVHANLTNTSTATSVSTITYDDTALKSENAILKAKVQALEDKVYQCVQ